MTVWAKDSKILKAIIFSISINMVKLQRNRVALPFPFIATLTGFFLEALPNKP